MHSATFPADSALDTRAQDTGHSAPPGYPAPVDTENTQRARQAIERLTALQEQADEARAERDAAIAAMHLDGGMRAPDIARALDMSVSNVRLVLAVHKPRA